MLHDFVHGDLEVNGDFWIEGHISVAGWVFCLAGGEVDPSGKVHAVPVPMHGMASVFSRQSIHFKSKQFFSKAGSMGV